MAERTEIQDSMKGLWPEPIKSKILTRDMKFEMRLFKHARKDSVMTMRKVVYKARKKARFSLCLVARVLHSVKHNVPTRQTHVHRGSNLGTAKTRHSSIALYV